MGARSKVRQATTTQPPPAPVRARPTVQSWPASQELHRRHHFILLQAWVPRRTTARAPSSLALALKPIEGHLSSVKRDVCFFHRNRAGCGLTTGVARSRRRSRASTIVLCPSTAPTALGLGLLGMLFFGDWAGRAQPEGPGLPFRQQFGSSAEAVQKQCGSSAEAVRKQFGSSAEAVRRSCGSSAEV